MRHIRRCDQRWEIWASAQSIIKQHGGKAPDFIAQRIIEAATKNDAEGVATWKAIADRVDQLMDFKGSGWARH